jgi:hypothetical protein
MDRAQILAKKGEIESDVRERLLRQRGLSDAADIRTSTSTIQPASFRLCPG